MSIHWPVIDPDATLLPIYLSAVSGDIIKHSQQLELGNLLAPINKQATDRKARGVTVGRWPLALHHTMSAAELMLPALSCLLHLVCMQDVQKID